MKAYLFGLLLASAAFSQDLDFVIRGGKLVDGTGNPWRMADVGIREFVNIKTVWINDMGRHTGSATE